MHRTLTDTPPRRAALVAGVGYLAIFVLAVVANFVVRGSLVVPDDAAATYANVAESETLFRAGLIAFLAVFVLDVAIAWGLYLVLRPVAPALSLLAAWFRIVYTVFLGVALVFWAGAIAVTGGEEFMTAFDQGQREAQVTLLLQAFDWTWLIGLVAFGLHLVVVGGVLVASRLAPRALGIVLVVAGLAYVVDTLAHALMTSYADYADAFLAMVALPSMVGEMWLALWLLARAGRGSATRITGSSPVPVAVG
ncbi:MAG: DUF4386 domain-containing protein [Candidatus Nanopelagicales bacterium]